MIKKWLVYLFVLAFSFIILFISILRSASVKYSYSQFANRAVNSYLDPQTNTIKVDYMLPNPGSVLPDHPLWGFKAARDRLWFLLTTSITKKSELKLLFADKRLQAANILFDGGKFAVGYSTLTKAEKYLEEASLLEKQARDKGLDTGELATRLAAASLKHRQIINEIKVKAPDDLIPSLIEVEKYSVVVYTQMANFLKTRKLDCPKNPFNGD